MDSQREFIDIEALSRSLNRFTLNPSSSSNPNHTFPMDSTYHGLLDLPDPTSLLPMNLTQIVEDNPDSIFRMAINQQGCNFLQQKISEGRIEDLNLLFNKTISYFPELMVHPIGNYFAQNLLEVCNPTKVTHILLKVVSDQSGLLNICVDDRGAPVMQKLIEKLTVHEQRMFLVSALRPITFIMSKINNGYHVLLHCLIFFPTEENTSILNVIAVNCFEIAIDKFGCRFLQKCLSRARGIPWIRIVTQIIDNAYALSQNPYGNYVVQYLIALGIRVVNFLLLSRLFGNFLNLSLDKFGSNVVEKLINNCEEDQKNIIFGELTTKSTFLSISQHPYGNFVAQAVLLNSRGNLLQQLTSLVMMNSQSLHNHPYGEKVWKKARDLKLREQLR